MPVSSVPMITAVALTGMPEFVEAELGPSALRRIFRDSGLPPDTQLQEGFFIPEIALQGFLGSATRLSGDEVLGALIGTQLDIATYGTWGQYVLEGADLQTCLARFVKLIDCFMSYSGFRIVVDDDLAWVRHRYASRGTSDYLQLALGSAGSVVNIIRHYAGNDFTPTLAEIDAPKPNRLGLVEERLSFPIVYDAPEFGVAFPKELLVLPRRGPAIAQPITANDVRRAVKGRRPHSFCEAVREIIRLQVRTDRPRLDDAARQLDCSSRTLQRRIDQEGLSFRELATRIRLERAQELLIYTTLSTKSVADAVGYSDPFNFSRAYQKHFGRRPSSEKPNSPMPD